MSFIEPTNNSIQLEEIMIIDEKLIKLKESHISFQKMLFGISLLLLIL
jgi:hypothetical protein